MDVMMLLLPDGFIIHKGKVYITDYGNRCTAVFLTDSKFQRTIGRGQLGYPCDVAITGNNER